MLVPECPSPEETRGVSPRECGWVGSAAGRPGNRQPSPFSNTLRVVSARHARMSCPYSETIPPEGGGFPAVCRNRGLGEAFLHGPQPPLGDRMACGHCLAPGQKLITGEDGEQRTFYEKG